MLEQSRSPADSRDRAMALAIGSSLVSKAGTLLLQLAALPLAVRLMGVEGFALYSLFSGMLTVLSFADLGAGPMMTRKIAASIALDKKRQIGEAVYGGIAASCLAALLLLGLGTAFGLGMLPLSAPALTLPRSEVVLSLFTSMVCGLCQLAAAFAMRVLGGYQLTHYGNMGSAVGVFMSAVCVSVLSVIIPLKPWMLIAAVFFPVAFAQVVGGYLALRKQALWSLARRYGSMRATKELMVEGAGIAVIGGLVPFIEREVTKWTAALQGDARTVAHIGVGFQIVSLFGGIIMMITSPLVAAIADANARGDYAWLKRRVVQVRALLLTLIIGVLIGGIVFGPKVVTYVLGAEFQLSSLAITSICVSFGTYAWVQFHWTITSSFGVIWRPALYGLCEAILILSLFWIAPRIFGEVSLFFILPVVILSISGWLLPKASKSLLGKAALKEVT